MKFPPRSGDVPTWGRGQRPQAACQGQRQQVKKKGKGCSNSPCPVGQLSGDSCLKFTAPVRDCSSYRGNLLSTVQPVGKQGHHDASHGLRGCVQQELLHVDNLLYRSAAPGAFLARRAVPDKGG